MSKRYEELPNGKRVVVVTCCGSDIYCDAFTNSCPHCGTDYNNFGDRLASRSQWGEETGERWFDLF
jgi:hypothetical protein